jgi:Fungal Zn(2)-Cys(6) binuclear cluster domain
MDTDDAPQSSPPGPRKGMRRGTHSCFECRRRKIRCIFAKDSTVCEGCAARGKRCTEQRRELLQEAALDTRESLRERVARLEAIIQASSSDGGRVTADQAYNRSELTLRDTQADTIQNESSSSSTLSHPTPASILSPNASVSIDKGSAQNLDPIVTIFDNAIVRFTVC